MQWYSFLFATSAAAPERRPRPPHIEALAEKKIFFLEMKCINFFRKRKTELPLCHVPTWRSLRSAWTHWARASKNHRILLLKHEKTLLETRCALLHQKIADLEEKHRRFEEKLAKPNDKANTQATRVVCFCDSDNYFECERGHVMCLSCIDNYCRDRLFGESLDVYCQSITGCSCLVPPHILLKCGRGKSMYDERVHRRTLDRLLEWPSLQHVHMRLRYLVRDGTFRAYSCPKCRFGPMEHTHCSDLVEHHGRNRTDNSCPQCGHRVRDVSELARWT